MGKSAHPPLSLINYLACGLLQDAPLKFSEMFHFLRFMALLSCNATSHQRRFTVRLLDLFCCGGLASAGYWQSGCFSEVVGVDINDMAAVYPFDFVRSNAIELTYDFLLQFDFIHASPPCQAYSKATPKEHKDRHVRLIAATHLMLQSSGKPYVIENVEGSSRELRPNLVLSGNDVGLSMRRVRYFHLWGLPKIKTRFSSNISSGQNFNPHGGAYTSRSDLISAFGLNELPASHLSKLTMYHIEQGIPPAMTRYIAANTLSKFMIG